MLSYFINDAEPMPTYNQTSWLDEHSAAWVVFQYRLDSLMRQFGEAPDWALLPRRLRRRRRRLAADPQALQGFATTAREMGVGLVVFHIPRAAGVQALSVS